MFNKVCVLFFLLCVVSNRDILTSAESEICSEPMKIGSCKKHLILYYYDKAENKCKPFGYSGCDGNGNRFKSKEDCEVTCQPSVCLLPFDFGACSGHTIRFGYDKNLGQCKSFHFRSCAGNGNNFHTMRNCEARCVPDCNSPIKSGNCFANLTRFAWDVKQGECTSFSYTGCRGNLNNFPTMQECEKKCKRESICYEPRIIGKRQLKGWGITKYSYDVLKDKCVSFHYRGREGNSNNFITEAECKATCKPGVKQWYEI